MNLLDPSNFRTRPTEAPTAIAALRRRLEAAEGLPVWRSLDELAETPQFREALQREFPVAVREWGNGFSRRNFLQLMGASLALAGLYGCSYRPEQKIVPYVNPPEELVPGKPLYFATTAPFCGHGRGVLVESHEGRPTKIEGNPDHPASLGGTDVWMQASILDLYDPDRSKVTTLGGNVSSWSTFLVRLGERLQSKSNAGGAGIAILTATQTSPTVLAQQEEIRKRFPSARWFVHEPTDPAPQPHIALYSFEKATVILSLDSDFLMGQPMSLRDSRRFIDKRRVRRGQTAMNRLYALESTPTITGSMADHRLPAKPSQIELLAQAILGSLSSNGANPPAGLGEAERKWVDAVSADLRQAGSSGLVAVGVGQPTAVHEVARQINDLLKAVGNTVSYPPAPTAQAEPLAKLADSLNTGQTDTLLILDCNPVYTAPVDLDFAAALQRFSSALNNGDLANFSACLSSHDDETAFRCQWHIPLSHYLESWGDLRSPDGTASLVQPLIAPLYASRTITEVLEAVLGRTDRGMYEIVRAHWQSAQPDQKPEEFEAWWENALRKGVIEEPKRVTTPPPATASVSQPATAPSTSTTQPPPGGLEIIFRPDPCIWDGRYINNAWLQELPKPFTKLTWDNAALISPRLAEHNGLSDGDIVSLIFRNRSIEAPVMIQPGQADDTVTLHLGYGRERGVRLGYSETDTSLLGYNAFALRTTDALWSGAGLTLTKTGKTHRLVTTRSHHGMDPITEKGVLRPDPTATPEDSESELELKNRRLVRVATVQEFARNQEVIRDLGSETEKKASEGRKPLTLYPAADEQWDYTGKHKWGMSIDVNACIGCNACVLACQAENNIPVVGREQVNNQREMHWIRVDDYYAGSLDNPAVYHQPVPCMHCENAPCELVCPVGATTHSPEGINEMTYNRCIGTRYCSNNCPYKVRRFNFFNYQELAPAVQLQRNPDVTVRSRGVMEKCTYCIQRINRTRIDLEKTEVQLEDAARHAPTDAERDQFLQQVAQTRQAILNDLETACQQSCPTRAIIFGDLNDTQSHNGKGSLVRQLKEEPLDYGLLVELTTKPRTTYMGRLRNPNPRLETGGAA